MGDSNIIDSLMEQPSMAPAPTAAGDGNIIRSMMEQPSFPQALPVSRDDSIIDSLMEQPCLAQDNSKIQHLMSPCRSGQFVQNVQTHRDHASTVGFGVRMGAG